MMSRPITATIHHQALKHNLALARTMTPNSQKYSLLLKPMHMVTALGLYSRLLNLQIVLRY